MVKSKSSFASAALHGPHSGLSAEARAARRAWLEDSYAREAQLQSVHSECLTGYADRGKAGPRRAPAGSAEELAVRRRCED